MMFIRISLVFALSLLLAACAQAPLRGTGDLGLIVERASGHVTLIDTSKRAPYARIGGLGDLSHASAVFSRDGRYAYVFGRDGGLTKIDLLEMRIVKRVMQAGNSIGGAVSQDGRLIVAQNYTPGGIKAFDAETLELLADVPAEYESGKYSKVVGLADAPGNRFVYALFEGGEIRVTDLSDTHNPITRRFPAGQQPYDGLISPDGRYYLAGLFGEDGVALLDLWQPDSGARRVLDKYGKGAEKLPVFKMPHLRGWSIAGGRAWLPAVGHHEVLVVDTATWRDTRHIPVKGQPVFVMASPDGRQIWVNFAHPDNGWVQVIDTFSGKVIKTLQPGKAVLHMEFTPRGDSVWISARDDNAVSIYSTLSFERIGGFPIDSPSGIFFTSRANRIGF